MGRRKVRPGASLPSVRSATLAGSLALAASLTPSACCDGATAGGGTDAGRAHVDGVALAVTDTNDVPSSAFTRGAVVLVPADAVTSLGRLGGFRPEDREAAVRASFALSASQIGPLGATVARIGESGRFRADVAAGDYVVCLADVFAGQVPAPAYSVVGCAPTQLAAGARTLTVGFGEAGVETRVR